MGLGVGAGIQSYTGSLFGPSMLAEFGWSRSVFALQGTAALVMFLVVPFVGRLTDLFGARRIAAFGVVALPLSFVATSLQNGNIALFFFLSFLNVMVSSATSGVVYCRLVAVNFTAARGLALAICASAPAVVMALCIPLLGVIVEQYGWRAGYRTLAAVCLVVGLLAIWIIPSHASAVPASTSGAVAPDASEKPIRDARAVYRAIFGNAAFWIIFGGMLLCNLPTAVTMGQFGLMLIEQKVAKGDVALVLSVYAACVVVGRFACGLALDRFPTHIVAALSMGLPAIGLLVLGQKVEVIWVVLSASALIGLSQGAEGDLMQYLVARYFPREIFSSVSGLVMGGLALSIVLGALMLSGVLKLADSYLPFLTGAGVITGIGGALFLMLGRPGVKWDDPAFEMSAS